MFIWELMNVLKAMAQFRKCFELFQGQLLFETKVQFSRSPGHALNDQFTLDHSNR